MSYITEENKRSAGVLLHISSLPGRFGIGTFGKTAYDFVDILSKNNVKYWQILPLVQTGFGDSPYQSVCCNSGNPYFIDPEFLKKDGLLTDEEVEEAVLPAGKVDYAALYNTRYAMLRKAYSRFDTTTKNFRAFVYKGEYKDYACYMTLKGAFSNLCFSEWDYDFKYNEPRLVEDFLRNNLEEYHFWQFVQFEFWKQWAELKAYANKNGVKFIGDIPLYVAYDSADVWANPKLFKLDKDLKQTEQAGVPPDYFCAEGQLWGNPLYDWDAHKKSGYRWWIHRIRSALKTYDVVRIDHFRGLDRYYAVKAGAENAIAGEWLDGPKMSLFEETENQLGELSIIAEDLGILDDGVRKLLKDSGFPGMKILLFAFDGDKKNVYRPENIEENSVCYTGTHDNSTVMGYLKSLTPEQKENFIKEVRYSLKKRKLPLPLTSDKGVCKALITMCLECDSDYAILPVQDIMCLDNEYRMNTPGTSGDNWSFRLTRLPDEREMSYVSKLIKKYHRE